MCCWSHKTARILVTRGRYPVGPDSYSLLYTALIAVSGDTKKCTSMATEDQHGQLAETPPAIEVNRGGTSLDQPPTSSSLLWGPIFLLVTFLLVSSCIEEDSTQQQFTGFSVQPFLASAEPSSSRYRCSSHLRFWQPALCKKKKMCRLFSKKWHEEIKRGGRLVKPWPSSGWLNLSLCHPPRCCELTVRCLASPEPAKVEQRGWAAKRCTQWHMLSGFLGTAWETVALLCQASLYCRSPLAVAHQATRAAEKVFHWALIEKTPPWI